MKTEIQKLPIVRFFMKLGVRQKVLLSCLAVLVCADVAVVCLRLSGGRYSKAGIVFEQDAAPAERMIAVNSGAARCSISKSGYALFRLTEAQRRRLAGLYGAEGALSVTARIGLPPLSEKKRGAAWTAEQPLYFGFLTDADFDAKGRFSGSFGQRVLSGADLRNFLPDGGEEAVFDVALAVEKNLPPERLPCGFFIYSSLPVQLYGALVGLARVGFDFSGAVPFFGVPSNGGTFSGRADAVDFSGCSMVFPAQNSSDAVMPKIELAFAEADDYGTPERPLSVKLNAGGEVLSVHPARGVASATLQAAALLAPFGRFELSENARLVTRLVMTSNSRALIPSAPARALAPLRMDPGLLIGSRPSAWRVADYELYEWDRFPGILFFDTRSYAVQDDFFRRLAFFVEKAGYRGRILTDAELGDMHGYNAHDYSAESLAAFFTEALRTGAALNARELLLRDILLQNGVIAVAPGGFSAGCGAVISISQESPDWLRRSLSAHEIWHGIFFTDEAFRNAVAAVYYTIDEKSLDFITGYWKSQPTLGYDPADAYLMHNEFMAYIMQQPLASVAGYFVHLANRGSVMRAMPELCEYVRRTGGSTFEDAARVFDSYAFDNWGLSCGRVSLVERR